jgi:hypothetical protein
MQIEHYKVDFDLREKLERGLEALRDEHVKALEFKQEPERGACGPIGIDHEDAVHRGDSGQLRSRIWLSDKWRNGTST